MSMLPRLEEIKQLVSLPLLNAQDELDNGLRALAGLRYLLAGHTDPDSEGLHELVVMTEERFRRADDLLKVLAENTLGPRPRPTPH